MVDLLLLDAGNTQLKIGGYFHRDQRVELFTTLPIARIREELPHWLAQQSTLPHTIFGSNVASAHTAAILEDLFSGVAPIQWLKSEKQTLSLINSYDPPAQLGTDRWMAMISIWHHRTAFDGPRMVVSCGTATTIDSISPDGVFLGGMILPGWNMMLQSLAKGTANLPFAQSNDIVDFPTNTHSAIISGCLLAQTAAITQQQRLLLDTFGKCPEIHASGGAWNEIGHAMRKYTHTSLDPNHLFYHPHPVLDGIAITARLGVKEESSYPISL